MRESQDGEQMLPCHFFSLELNTFWKNTFLFRQVKFNKRVLSLSCLPSLDCLEPHSLCTWDQNFKEVQIKCQSLPGGEARMRLSICSYILFL
jgi:hypothetical protein